MEPFCPRTPCPPPQLHSKIVCYRVIYPVFVSAFTIGPNPIPLSTLRGPNRLPSFTEFLVFFPFLRQSNGPSSKKGKLETGRYWVFFLPSFYNPRPPSQRPAKRSIARCPFGYFYRVSFTGLPFFYLQKKKAINHRGNEGKEEKCKVHPKNIQWPNENEEEPMGQSRPISVETMRVPGWFSRVEPRPTDGWKNGFYRVFTEFYPSRTQRLMGFTRWVHFWPLKPGQHCEPFSNWIHQWGVVLIIEREWVPDETEGFIAKNKKKDPILWKKRPRKALCRHGNDKI